MTIEANIAIIDDPTLETKEGKLVGACKGIVMGFDRSGVVVEVSSTPEVCKKCSFGEKYCTQSKAD